MLNPCHVSTKLKVRVAYSMPCGNNFIQVLQQSLYVVYSWVLIRVDVDIVMCVPAFGA